MEDGFLENYFKKNHEIYDRFSFDNFFRLLLNNDFEYEEALHYILCNCSLSAYVFQERIHNMGYEKLSAEDVLPADLAATKARLIHDLMSPKNT